MLNNKHHQWTVWEISDSDEPGDAILTGMRHRDFDDVMLLLVPEGEPGGPDWYGTPKSSDGRPTRPILLFVKGELPAEEQALTWVLERGDEAETTWVPFPDTFDDPPQPEAAHSVLVHFTYPPFPWLEEARLGMAMGRYYNAVDLVNWVEPKSNVPGVFNFKFFRSGDSSTQRFIEEIPDDMLPF